MATQSKQYKQQPILSGLFINGLIISLAFIFLLGGAYVGYVFYVTVKSAVARATLPGLPSVDLSLPLAAIPLTGSDGAFTLPQIVRGGEDGQIGLTGAALPDYSNKERVNILLLGVDRRPDEVYSRTDTMMLVTVDPKSRTAGMLSVPRDLWVSIPGYGEDRINKAYFFGDRDDYPGGGPALAMKTVQYNLGVPVHFYAQIDFQGFEEIVNTLGGIDINVPQTIDDPTFPDNNYGYDPFYIEAGLHTLDGHDAMRYARTRHSSGGDFSRARRQQQVMLAIRDKALQLDMIPRIPELWTTMSGTIETDLQLVDIVELAQLADEINVDNIQSNVIDSDMTVDYVVPETGAQVLLPLREKIAVAVEEIFSEKEPVDGPTKAELEAIQAQATAQAENQAQQVELAAQRQEEIKTFLTQESAKLVVQNGTNVSNLASQTAAYLKSQGFDIIQFGPADAASYTNTVIVVYNEEKQYTLEVLKSIFDIQEENIRRSPNLKSDVDFRVLIGSNFDLPEGDQLPLSDSN
ncbi:MAG: LCP family protein [Anaerolineae bacterium]|nr:LCP family protein [Anaerolineae bacterium]